MALMTNRPETRAPKEKVSIIIIRSCLGRPHGAPELPLQHLELGTKVEMSEQEARQIVMFGAAGLYIDRKDDPSRGAWTLTPDRQRALECEVAMVRQAAERRAEEEEDMRAARRQRRLPGLA